jgi:hypothetical protein
MDYTIISIDDSRQDNKNQLRLFFLDHTEVQLDFCNGKDPVSLRKAKEHFNVPTPGPFKAGEFGIFFSVLTCLEYGAENNGIIYFEDDAIPTVGMCDRVTNYINSLPEDWDCFAIWSPTNQYGDYTSVASYDSTGVPVYGQKSKNIFDCDNGDIVRLWQGYGNVAFAFSKKGSVKLLDHIRQEGFYSPIDCLICIATHRNVLSGYALKPHTPNLVNYDWDRPTTIHKSRWGMIDQLMEEL